MSKRVLHDLLLQNLMAVSASPDEKRILTKTKHAQSYELIVKDLITSKHFRTISAMSQFETSWAPDGKAIAFLSRLAPGKPFHVFLWNLSSSTPKLLPLPESAEAVAPILWSARGKEILYASVSANTRILRLARLQNNTAQEVTSIAVSGTHAYAWSPDGSRFYAVEQSQPEGIVETSLAGVAGRRMVVRDVDTINSLGVSSDGHTLLVSGKKQSERWLHILGMNLRDRQQTSCLRADADLELPIGVANGEVVVSMAKEGTTLLAKGGCGQQVKIVGPLEGRVEASETTDQHHLLARYTGETEPAMLVRIDLQRGSYNILYRASYAKLLSIPPPERFTFRSAEGLPVNGLLWRSQSPMPYGHRVVVSAAGWVDSGWTMLQQVVLKGGADYVVLQDRSKAVGDAAFEKGFTPDTHVDDVVRGIKYVIQRLHPLNGKVVLEGSSYGAYLATRAARLRPDLLEAVVIESMTGNDPAHEVFIQPARPLVRIYQFHGDSDPGLSVSEAHNKIEMILGKGATEPPSGCFTVLKNEGHVVENPDSLAVMWGVLPAITRNRPGENVSAMKTLR